MLLFILVVIFLIGSSLTLYIKKDINPLLLLGLSLPIGLGVWSLMLFSYDIVGIKINNPLLLTTSLIIILLGLLFINWKNGKLKPLARKVSSFSSLINNQQLSKNFKTINPVYILFIIIVFVIVFAVVSKTLFWPIFNFDAIHGYDFIAKVIDQEGTYRNSIFLENNPLYSTRSFYPPLFVHALSIGYIFGTGTTKIISVIFLLSTLISLYALTLRYQSHTLAILAVFILCITPEYMGQSALVANNPVCAFYILISLASFGHYLRSMDKTDFYLSILTLGFSIWTRTEAIIFAIPFFILLLKNAKRLNKNVHLILLSICSVTPFIFWQLFLNSIDTAASQPIIKKLFYDPEKLSNLINQIKTVLFNTNFYALSVYILLFAIITNLLFDKFDKTNRSMTFILIMSFIFYIGIYYQLDTQYTQLTEGSWVGSGFKRGLLYFFPIGCYYIGSSFLSKKIFTS